MAVLFHTRLGLFASIALTAGTLAACGDGSDPASGDSGGDTGGEEMRIAALFSGSTTDADYNLLGLQALEAAEEEYGAETAYSENVPVPDTERVIREYLADGYNIIWTHGSQFYEATAKVAGETPDVTFIGEFDDEPSDPAPNVWVIDRNFQVGFYPVGAMAGLATQTGKIGYVGGLSLPFSYSEVHAMQQALDDMGSDAVITPVWTGDFNDPAKAQQITAQLLGAGNDVIVGSLNLGAVGMFQATKEADPGTLVTAKYTDKSQSDPDHYAASVLYDFSGPLSDVLGEIAGGTTSGYLPLGFDTGVSIQPSENLDDAVAAEVQQVVDDIVSGAITVEKKLDPIE